MDMTLTLNVVLRRVHWHNFVMDVSVHNMNCGLMVIIFLIFLAAHQQIKNGGPEVSQPGRQQSTTCQQVKDEMITNSDRFTEGHLQWQDSWSRIICKRTCNDDIRLCTACCGLTTTFAYLFWTFITWIYSIWGKWQPHRCPINNYKASHVQNIHGKDWICIF